MMDSFHDVFHLAFRGSNNYIKIRGHRRSQIPKGNEGRVREGKNTTKEEDSNYYFAIRFGAGRWRNDSTNRNVAVVDNASINDIHR